MWDLRVYDNNRINELDIDIVEDNDDELVLILPKIKLPKITIKKDEVFDGTEKNSDDWERLKSDLIFDLRTHQEYSMINHLSQNLVDMLDTEEFTLEEVE